MAGVRWTLGVGLLVAAASVMGETMRQETPATPQEPAAWRELVAAERAFARTAVDRGTREAFLTYLAADALLFRPRPEPGRAHWEKRPEPNTVLSWEPEFAAVARAGDLGYTTGPWTLRDKADSKRPPSHGRYVSIWERGTDAAWRVVIDLGIVHARPDSAAGGRVGRPERQAAADSTAGPEATPGSLAHELLAADRALARAAASAGAAAAFDSLATDDIRLLRMGYLPFVGRAAVVKALAAKPGHLTWEPAAAVVSRSGDLGYSYGSAEFRARGSELVDRAGAGSRTERLSYVRIWRREPKGPWLVALDIALPLPAEKGESGS